jgi:Putative DNA-binding domain
MPLESSQHDVRPLHYAAAFSSALMRPDLATPSLVIGPKGKSVSKRYNVYRNNVTVSLIDALAAVFPAVQRITGVEFFRAMARIYVREMPPRSPLLFEYGQGFPEFIERYEYAGQMPWLADVARIERSWLDAYHAADADPLSADDLRDTPSERLADLRLAPRPATRVVRSRFAAVTIFAANRTRSPFGEINAAEPEDALITRPKYDVAVRRLPPGGADFLLALLAGRPLGAAVASAVDVAPSFDIAASVAGMIEAGAFAKGRIGGPP